MRKIFLCVVLMIACMQLSAAPPIMVSPVSVVPLLGSSIGRYEKFELGIKLSHDMPDPFDPDEIEVYAIFTNLSTGTEERVNGFWYQDYDMDEASPDPTMPSGPCSVNSYNVPDPAFLTAKPTDLNWRIRFSPDEEGVWEYVVYAKNGPYVWPSATVQQMVCVPSANKGNVGIGSNNTHFIYKGGDRKGGDKEENFIPLGLNVRANLCVSPVFNRGEYKFVKTNIEDIASARGNTIRLFMTFDEFGIEWEEDGLGTYFTRQKQAYALDRIFELAEQNNIKIQLVLTTGGDELKPYLALLADPGHNQFELFSNSQCKDYFKRRLRYIIARWGYSTSILAYEFWNEVGLLGNANSIHDGNPIYSIWDAGNATLVDKWHTEMVDYAKTMDNRHMFTTSLGGPVCNDLVGTSLDYLGDHWYSNNKNVCFNISAFAQRSMTRHNKPYFLGESGPGTHGCFPWQLAFTRSSYGTAPDPHDDIWFHNDLWSSLFNGSAGADMYWYGYTILGPCAGNAYKGFGAASRFLEDDDFFTRNLKFVTNQPAGDKGPKDIPTGTGAGYFYGNNSIPVQEYYGTLASVPANPLADYLHYDITTSNDKLIDVFASNTTNWEGKIYGWVHLNDYYWGNTRFVYDCAEDPDINHTGVSPNQVATLERQTMTFKNVDCDGYYKVDFYSTWPDYDVNGDGTLDQGGIVAPFHQDWIPAHCGQLTVNIPKLTPLASLSTAPYAPDYAFKITKMSDAWSHSLVDIGLGSLGRVSVYNSNKAFYSDYNGAIRTSVYDYSTNTFQHTLVSPVNPSTNEKVNGVLCANENTQVFYKGNDGRLQCYYMDNSGVYNHIWMTDWSGTSQNVGNYIIIGPYTIYYQGADAKVHRYFFDAVTQTWSHSILPYSGDPSQLVGGAMAMNTAATQVYYKGNDSRLQCYYLDNSGTWNHIWMTDWSGTSQNVAGDVKCAPEGIFYAGTDGKLHKYYFDAATSTWVHTYVLNQYNAQIDIPANTQISLKGNADLVYFKGTNGHMQQLYAKLGINKYTQDEVLCEADLVDGFKNNGNIAAVDAGEIYYIGTDNNLHMYAWNAGCNPRSEQQNGKTGKMGRGTVEDLSDKFGSDDAQSTAANMMPISIAPNPFSDRITVNTNNAELLVAVDIVDVYGRKVFASTDLNYKFEINTDAFAPGLYVVTIYSKGTVIKKEKVVKK